MTNTPETDNLARGNHVVPTEFAQQLEVQRNEARGWAEAAWAKSDRAEKMLRIAAAKADEAQADYERVCRALAAAKADEWRECADGLASALHQMRDIPDYAEFALTQFERLKESQP
jgi:translation initiation factor 2 alpha subunit (eIF-2alpha)